MKRVFDITAVIISLLFLLPIFGLIAILIKLETRGSFFSIYKRIGRNFKAFNLYKFRTEIADTPQKVFPITAGDPRITRWGRFLRKTKIDKLPQLWNVLKGDMSLVGPTPGVREYVSKYRMDYRKILKLRPGIIDLASMNYGDKKAISKDKKDPKEYYIHVLLPEKINLAKEYVRKASLVYDLKLILLRIYPHGTVLKIMKALTPYRRPLVIGTQLIIFVISNYLAFFIRFDSDVPYPQFGLFLKYLPLLLFFRIISLFTFSLDRGLWKYASVRDLFNITAATSHSSLLFYFSVRYLSGETSYARAIYVVDWFLNIFLLGGIRLIRRIHERANNKETAKKKRIIVIGAGDAAEMLLRDIERSHFYPYQVVGLIDDDPEKKGLKIRDLPILGTRKDLESIVEHEDPEEFLIAIPSASPSRIQSIVKDLRQFGLPVKMLPGLWGVLSGRDYLSQIKEVKPDDVLFRAPACDGCRELNDLFKGKRVMITGAGGSIGSELARQIASFKPESLILFERHEESLFKVDMEIRSLYKSIHFRPFSIVGDILDEKRVIDAMERFQPEFVFHAAAYKHVPLMEDSPYEAFKTNVMGTKIAAEKSGALGVKKFILISTDKAVNPVNVMGTTKKMAEEIVYHLSKDAGITKYITVRFGNVLGSSGSVVPIFKEQIDRGGPVTVTHPEVTRYFMTIPEAVNLVLQAAVIGSGGEIFVLDMGKPIKILDLAKRMISLYGYKPGGDIDISFTGLRPGEKLYEELFNGYEEIENTAHPKIKMAISNGKTNRNILESSIKNIMNAYQVKSGEREIVL